MQNTTIVQKGNVRAYFCGGTGINIGSIFESCRGTEDSGVAPVDGVYLDTSKANFTAHLPVDSLYVVPGDVDGSGGERVQNSAVIRQHIKDMLQKHRPGYVNIVVSSGSGGSGSVIAPSLVHELLSRDALVIPVIVGDARTGSWIKNTMATLATYEKVSTVNNRALSVGYFENTKKVPPSEVDKQITELVVAIAVLFSRQNEGLDTRDLYNFLNFDRMTSYAPHCGLLTATAGEINESNCADIMTVVTAALDKDHTGVEAVVPYAKQGILPAGISKDVTDRAPLHLMTKAYPFNDIADRLRAELRRLDEEASARTKTSNLLQGATADDDFLVL